MRLGTGLATAKLGGTAVASIRRGANTVYDADATTYLKAVEAADGQGLEPAVAKAIQDFVVGLKATSAGIAADPTRTLWDAVQASCIMCGARTISGALVPLKRPYGAELVDIDSLPTPNIENDGAPTNGVWDAATLTMSNDAVGGSTYPRFRFAFAGITVGKRYRVSGRFSGDVGKVLLLGLGNGSIGSPEYNYTTGEFDAVVEAAAANFSVYTRGDLAPSSITIESLSIREDSFTPTPNNFVSDDYNRSTGLSDPDATSWLDSNRANDADGQDDNHWSVYITAPQTVSGRSAIGTADNVSVSYKYHRTATGGSDGRPQLQNNTATNYNTTNTDEQPGLSGTSRESASGYDWVSGGQSGAIAAASVTPSAYDIYIHAINSDGSAAIHSDARLAFYSIGSALDLAALDTKVTALVAAVSAALA